MIESSVDADHNLVTIKNTGHGTQATVDAGFRLIKRQFDKFGPVKLLIDWSEFQGIGDAAPNLARRFLDCTEFLERVAFVAGPSWSAEAKFWMRLIGGKPVKLFDSAEKDAAVAWLLSG